MPQRYSSFDDHENILKLFSTALQSVGYNIIGTAPDGKVGSEMHKELNPDIILLDFDMPVMNGLEALRAIKASDPDAVVFMLTATKSDDNIIDCLSEGSQGYLQKSGNVAQIISDMTKLRAQVESS
jgi:two-component system, chemotaxis family, chemotaxis protein CheY